MTLRRKLAYQITAMILGLLLVSGLAVWGLVGLKHNFDAALAGYEQLRRVYAVGSHVGTARTLVSMSRHGEPPALAELRAAQQLLDTTDIPRSGATAGPPPARPAHAATIRKGIVDLVRDLESRRASPAAQTQLLDPTPFTTIEQSVIALAADIRAEIQHAQETADTRRRATIFTVASVCAAVILAALLLGLSQYRTVMRPLTDLSAAVKRIAAGDFSSKVPTQGPNEFATLAADFNRTATELESLYRDLEEKVETKSRQLVRSERLASVGYLAAGVAHEINNPLGIIAGHAELSLQQLARTTPANAPVGAGSPRPPSDVGARHAPPSHLDANTVAPPSPPPLSDDLRHTLQTIADEAFRCKAIINKLLSLARPGDDDRQIIPLTDIARSVVSLVAALPEHRNRTVTLDVQPDADTNILASENEMKQVLLNLTLNALESFPSDGGNVTISLSRPDDHHVTLSVTDTGRGMPPDVLDHVFEPFFTTKRGSASPGTGLGLSISHAIIQSHHGTLTAHSDGANKGATFTLTLPAATLPVGARHASPSLQVGQSPVSATRGHSGPPVPHGRPPAQPESSHS